MPSVDANGIRIEYDTFGDGSAPALLLIAGNGAQLTIWEPEFCEALARTGLYVIRFDMLRQNVAIMACGDRRARLSAVRAPTLVIHGSDDPLIPVEGGKDTTRAIPGATLLIIKGMGHDTPRGVWPDLIGAIASHAAKAGARIPDQRSLPA